MENKVYTNTTEMPIEFNLMVHTNHMQTTFEVRSQYYKNILKVAIF